MCYKILQTGQLQFSATKELISGTDLEVFITGFKVCQVLLRANSFNLPFGSDLSYDLRVHIKSKLLSLSCLADGVCVKN